MDDADDLVYPHQQQSLEWLIFQLFHHWLSLLMLALKQLLHLIQLAQVQFELRSKLFLIQLLLQAVRFLSVLSLFS